VPSASPVGLANDLRLVPPGRRTEPEISEGLAVGGPAGEESLPPLQDEDGRTRETVIVRRGRAQKTVLLVVAAGIVVLGGALLVWRLRGGEGAAPPATATPTASVPASASAAPTGSARVEVPAASEVPSAGGEVAPVLPGMAVGQGTIRVKQQMPGNVYLNGALIGPTNQVLLVPCGARFMRVASPERVGGRTVWLTKGATVKVPCGALTDIELPR
jgi:hypothetical protein